MEETWAFINISGRHNEPQAKAPLWCYGENEYNPEGSSRRSQSLQDDIMILPPSLPPTLCTGSLIIAGREMKSVVLKIQGFQNHLEGC